MFRFLKRNKKTIPALTEIDELYRDTVMYLDEKTRLEYCNGLIWRCQDDGGNTKDKAELKRLEQLVTSATNELDYLKKLLRDNDKP